MDRTNTRTPAPRQRRGSSHARDALTLLGASLLGASLLAAAMAAPAAMAQSAVPSTSAGWPRTLTDDEGTSITLDAPPQRVVSLSPANTEIAFAIGAGDLLVGGTDYDDYPPEAAALPDVVVQTSVLLEPIVALEPDLVLAAGNDATPPAAIERLRDLGLPVLVVYAETVDEVVADVELIGEALDRSPQAAAVAADMRGRLADVEAAVDGIVERPRTFYEIGYGPEVYGPADNSFVADMVALAGGEPVTTGDPNVWSIPLERLVTADPQVIVLGDATYGTCPDAVVSRPGWSGITAVRDGAIRPVDDIVVTRPGPRLAEGLASLARAIHPGLELPGFGPARTLC